MASTNFKALILSGDGINCEKETARAAQSVGFQTEIIHANDFLLNPEAKLLSAHLFIIPGGFSFGDELGSGKILALKLKQGLKQTLQDYINRGGLVLGICNGFQVLVQLGIWGERVALVENSIGHFLNRWVKMKITGDSVFTKKLKINGQTEIFLPVRHGEGRLFFVNNGEAQNYFQNQQCVLQYEEDINGSWNQIAALSAYDGRVLGMMPHPEAFWTPELYPYGTEKVPNVPLGTLFFQSAYESLKEQQS